ncbi:hypothetical protein HL667_33615 [Bradyrhizobium sp. 83012]|uniref:TonB C-terminal domain-containing protein n=1 Tax=Bradyrhizobium aeschynomenes TaxID=2734909 RepID=A0ABX2CQJ7_9BRAD|nr:hypothetical protein [Bradyrhizobium aeschynomenes]NPU69970.1 hypothetical protein [Bradyrhizobium aeschynomenes]
MVDQFIEGPRRRRRRLREIALLASLIGAVIVYGQISAYIRQGSDADARAAGFADDAERSAAAAAGITSPDAWRAKVKAEEAARTKAAEAERLRQAERDAEAERKRPVTREMTISKISWEKAGFGNVALLNLTIANANGFAIRDVVLDCSFYGASGTEVSQRLHTIYDIVPAKASKRFTQINVGFIHNQSARGGCSIVRAARAS